MRSFAVLALCLGLFAVVQALEESEGVLLEGLVADEDMFKSGNVSVLHHWHRHGRHHHHDPNDHTYWHRRHSIKSEMLHCLKLAKDDCDLSSTYSLEIAGKRIAHCLLDHLEGCHDVPGLGSDITKSIPFIMAVKGFKALMEAGDDGLVHAEMVFGFYLAGGVQTLPDGTANFWYVAPASGGCASQLLALLTSGCQGADMKQIWALAKVVAKLIEKIYTSTAPDLGLGNCVADIPAVLVSLFTTTCPSQGYLFNPLLGTTDTKANKVCTYVGANQYENSPGALLGGSIYSLLLLSGNARLQSLGFQLGFAAVRMALAATQTTAPIALGLPEAASFPFCFGADFTNPTTPVINPNGGGALSVALTSTSPFDSGVPLYSGTVPLSPPAYTPAKLGPDGQRVICASIAMMSGNPVTEAAASRTYTWQRNLMWQGSADIVNAIAKTVLAKPDATSLQQKKELCAITRAIYTFSTQPAPSSTAMAVVSVPVYDRSLDISTEYDWSCSTDGLACASGTKPAWLTGVPNFFVNKPQLAASPHYLGTNSPYDLSCKNLFL